MRWKMPNCALIGVLAVGLVVAYAAVTIFLDFSGAFNLPPIRLLYLIGGTLLLVGLLRRSKVAWKATVAAATVLEVVSALCAVVFLLFSIRDPASFLFYALWALFVAVYMYVLSYVLRRPSCREYFNYPS